MLKIRFTLNQIGLQLQYYKNGCWRSASPIYKPEDYGGVPLLKTKILYAINPHIGRYEIVAAGDYKDEPGITVTCV